MVRSRDDRYGADGRSSTGSLVGGLDEETVLTGTVTQADLPSSELRPLFYPDSIAHVGASARQAPGRFNYSSFLLQMGYPGRLYPVNPKYDHLFDRPCYSSLAAIPDNVDMAILAVPASSCVELLRDLPRGKVRFVVVHTSGFGELHRGDLEAELTRLGREKGCRIVGPNCMGIYCQEARVGFWKDHWEMVEREGTVGFISQSGGHAVNLTLTGIDSGISFNKVISLGNQIDVSINDVLEYMGADEGINACGIYVENIRDGRRFLRLLREIVPRKPLVVWKGGLTRVGKEAAVTHTGSLAGDEQVFFAAMRQAGAIVVDSIHQMVRTLRLLQSGREPFGGRMVFFSPGGGNTVSICDHFTTQPHLRLPRLAPETVEALRELLPEENVDLRNPVDPGATGLLKMDKLIKVVGRDDQIDTLVLLISVDYLSNIKTEESRLLVAETICKTVAGLSDKIGKPICILLRQERENHEDFDRYRRLMTSKFNERDIPWVDGSYKDIAEIFSGIAGYRRHLAQVRARMSDSMA